MSGRACRLGWGMVVALGLWTATLRAAPEGETILGARGAETAGQNVTPPEASRGLGLSTSLGLLALAGAGAWLWWRGRAGQVVRREARRLAVEETRPLGNRQYLVVASYDGKKFLLGVCPGRIELVAALPDAAPENPNA